MASAAFNASPIEGVVGRLFDKPAWFKGPKPGGVEMQSASHFERGLVERAPTTKYIYQAPSEDREPEPRAHGEAYERYAKAADLYSVLAVIADNQAFRQDSG